MRAQSPQIIGMINVKSRYRISTEKRQLLTHVRETFYDQ